MYKESRRERRIRHSRRIARSRRAEHLAVVHGGMQGADVHCVCEFADTYFNKKTSLGCHCRSKRHGKPKLALGACHTGGGARGDVYADRRQKRRLADLSRRSSVDWQGDEAYLASSPVKTRP